MLMRYDVQYPVIAFVNKIKTKLDMKSESTANVEQLRIKESAYTKTFKYGSVSVKSNESTAVLKLTVDYDHFGFPPDKIMPSLSDYTFDMQDILFVRELPSSKVDKEIDRLKNILD